MKKQVVSIYGLGRFGKLWADILSNDHHVKVYSRRGLKPDEISKNQEIVEYENLFDCDAMFFCVAISSFKEVLKSAKNLFKPNTIYFDTCSVKVYPAQWMLEYLPENSNIIATHPMFGPDSYYQSEKTLPMVMCNVRAKHQLFQDWISYFNTKKMHVELMTLDEHDQMVAYSQGITHYIGRVLADLNLQTTRINTLGYQKLLEIIEQTCNDTWQLFVDLQQNNPYTKQMREELHDSLEKIYDKLVNNRDYLKS